MIAAGFEHERRGDDHRRIQRAAVAFLCQQAAQHIAAQRIADGRGRRGTKLALQPVQKPGAIFRFAGVIDAVIAVRFAAAAAGNASPLPASRAASPRGSDHGRTGCADCLPGREKRRGAALWRAWCGSSLQARSTKSPSGSLKALPVRGKAQFTANQPRQHGLQMTIAHAAHRMELTRIVFRGRHVCGG